MFFQANTRRDVLVHFLIIVALTIILLMSFFYIYLPATTNHGETITVPNIVGMKVDELEGFLEARDLRYSVNDSVFDPSKPPMTVILQNPLEGNQVKEGRKIYISITTASPPNVKMPRLTGRSLINAQGELESNGLVLGELKYIPDLQQNAVLKQLLRGKEITEGTEIPRGSKIDLVVGDGLGETEFPVPTLTGMPLDEAEFTLSGQGLQVGDIRYENIPDKELGTVYRQMPAPGSGRQIRVGEVIDLWVVGFPPGADSTNVEIDE
jgi:beta-lactam-binding protein with PASTA domain